MSPRGMRLRYGTLQFTFKEATECFKTQEPLVTHRLRHTYATELLSAGINIFSLKKILGHRDITMTLRYAEVTQAQLRKEYFEAVQRMEQEEKIQEQLLDPLDGGVAPNHIRTLHDLILEMRHAARTKKIADDNAKRIIKRSYALRKEIDLIMK